MLVRRPQPRRSPRASHEPPRDTPPSPRATAVAVAGVLFAGLALAWTRAAVQSDRQLQRRARDTALPQPRRDAGYRSESACRGCHAQAYASWHASYHRTMTQAVDATTVQADFEAEIDGEFAVEQRGETYWVRMPVARQAELAADPQAETEASASPFAWQRVVMSTGSHHLQVFWVHDPSTGRLVAFPWSYLLADQRWVPNEHTLLRPDLGEVRYVWNEVCVMCHAVAGQPGLDDTPATTRAADLGIACEACHGPGQQHADHYRSPLARYRQLGDDKPAEFVTNPARIAPREASAICGRCHSIWLPVDASAWRQHGLSHVPGPEFPQQANLVRHPADADQPWMDDVLADDPTFLVGRFWSDGMVRVVGREYNGLIASPCAASSDFGCTTCHSMHRYAEPNDQLTPVATGNPVCIACHGQFADEAELVAHTHHGPESSGSRCYNCHMPHTSYGLLQAVRSHEIDSPSVESALTTGRPTACNLCHIDRSLAWTADRLAQWDPATSPVADLGPMHQLPEIPRLLLQGDAGQRALAAWHLAWAPAVAVAGDDWQAPGLDALQRDPYGAVRWVAARARERLDAGRTQPPRIPIAAGDVRPLHDAEGRVDHAAIARLLARRDDRPVDLRE
ncbi:MAG: hypothetical protein B7733_19325 [Myxococcales bacterium FL481]|nr:MAG: hypothetical protein B7733_19325 [Myxococcales bacterium FL481]